MFSGLHLQSTRTADEHNDLIDRIKGQVRCFKCNSDVQRYEELKNLKDYLHYRIARKEYEAKVAAAAVSFEDFRRNHVQSELNKFDNAEKARQEACKWGWSPLYQIFKKWPLMNYSPGPWEHTEDEWVEMSAVLLENVKLDPLSLENECPHVLRAIMYLVRTLEGHKRPLAHPTNGLGLEYLLDLARSKDHSVSLTMVVQNMPSMGWMSFPGILDAVEPFSALHSDVVALLGYEPSKQVEVVDKIQSFLGKMAHRAVADMVRMHRLTELADLWYNDDLSKQRQQTCDEVRSQTIFCYSNFFICPSHFVTCNSPFSTCPSTFITCDYDLLHVLHIN